MPNIYFSLWYLMRSELCLSHDPPLTTAQNHSTLCRYSSIPLPNIVNHLLCRWYLAWLLFFQQWFCLFALGPDTNKVVKRINYSQFKLPYITHMIIAFSLPELDWNGALYSVTSIRLTGFSSFIDPIWNKNGLLASEWWKAMASTNNIGIHTLREQQPDKLLHPRDSQWLASSHSFTWRKVIKWRWLLMQLYRRWRQPFKRKSNINYLCSRIYFKMLAG